MINIADSRFQDELLTAAKRANKIDAGYRIPGAAPPQHAASDSRSPSPRSAAPACSPNIRSAPISRARKSISRMLCAGSRSAPASTARASDTIARALFVRPGTANRRYLARLALDAAEGFLASA